MVDYDGTIQNSSSPNNILYVTSFLQHNPAQCLFHNVLDIFYTKVICDVCYPNLIIIHTKPKVVFFHHGAEYLEDWIPQCMLAVYSRIFQQLVAAVCHKTTCNIIKDLI